MDDEKQKYYSYNALAREALFLGVPIMFFLALLGTGLFLGLLTLIVKNIFFTVIVIGGLLAVYFGMRILCANDSNALSIFIWQTKARLLKLKSKNQYISFGKCYKTTKKVVLDAIKKERV